jgi:tetratricopeptide (TPR) repeat protein
MKDDLNSSQPNLHSTPPPGDDLAAALEKMIAEAPFRTGAHSGAHGASRPANAGTCPELSDWFRMANGETPARESEALLAHAALCSACLAHLRDCRAVLSPDVSPEESVDEGPLASPSQEWQHRLAVELANTPRQRTVWKGMPLLFARASAGLAAMLLIVSGTVLWRQHENAPERLLAEAYAHTRSFELRVPGAGFAPFNPVTHLRGGAIDHEPPQLLTARSQIERKLERTPGDPHWLQLRARAYLLDEHYDAAIDILDRLLAVGPATASLLTDDGSAYFLRGTVTGSENDRARALDYLRRADELAPGDPVVLFNEALVMEDRGQLMNALETWNRYVKFERDPKWQNEGQERLKALEDRLNRLKTH